MNARLNAYGIILLFSLIQACSSSSLPSDDYRIELLRDANQQTWAEADFYASPNTGLEAKSINEAVELLYILKLQDNHLVKAWFREADNSCGILPVTVPPKLLVRVYNNNKLKLPIKPFKTVDQVPTLPCPSEVYEITPK